MISEANYDFSEFVHDNSISKIYAGLKEGSSLKLEGIPGIGKTTIMKRIHAYCSSGSEWHKDYFSFYISKSYNPNSFKSEIISQINSADIRVNSLNNSNIRDICKEAAEIIEKNIKGIKVVFLFDNFQKNFRDYHQDKDDNYTMLNDEAVTSIRNLSESDPNIFFIVSYTLPIDLLLSTDWYLNTFKTIYVELLSERESNDLVRLCRKNRSLETSDEILETIFYYGGRHPLLLDKAATTDFNKDEKDLLRWLKNRYIEIENKLQSVNPTTLEIMHEIVEKPITVDPENSFAQWYCYVDKESGNERYRLFSDHFADYLVKKYALPKGSIVPNSETKKSGTVFTGKFVEWLLGTCLFFFIAYIISGFILPEELVQELPLRVHNAVIIAFVVFFALIDGYYAYYKIIIMKKEPLKVIILALIGIVLFSALIYGEHIAYKRFIVHESTTEKPHTMSSHTNIPK